MGTISFAISRNRQKTDTIAAWCGFIWFNLIIDACYTWFLPDQYRLIIGFIFMIFATILLAGDGGVKMRGKELEMILPLLFFMLFLLIAKSTLLTIAILRYLPLFCIVCWRKSALMRFYELFKKFIVFYSVVSIFTEILVLSGLWKSLPHIIFPPQDGVQENQGIVNYFYGFFCIPRGDLTTLYRACGPLREGGHFSLFLGFVYFTEKVLHGKRNIWLIIAGLLTLSPNALLFFLITELYSATSIKQSFRMLGSLVLIVTAIVLVYLFSPQFFKDEVNRIIFERSLERNVENMGDDGFMALIDGRASYYGLLLYDRFTRSSLDTQLLGFSSITEDGYLMSDFRFILVRYGYLGLFLYLWSFYVFTVRRECNLYGICVLILVLIAFVQRAWMFWNVYFWVILLLVINAKLYLPNKTYDN